NAKELKQARREHRLSMPYLELLSLVHSINVWAHRLKRKAVILNCDCKSVVDAVNRGRAYTGPMMNLIRILLYITTINNVYIHLEHIPGDTNIDADLLSRSTCYNSIQFKQFMARHQTDTLQECAIKPLPILSW